jgi:hypothetical protein
MTEAGSVARRDLALAATIDVVAILLFVVLGRRSHDEGGSIIGDTVAVAAPFLLALGVGWLLARAWKAPAAPPTGIVIWLATAIGGMLLRRFVFDRGTALPFIIVASLFTLLFLVGWRVVNEWLAGRGKPSI